MAQSPIPQEEEEEEEEVQLIALYRRRSSVPPGIRATILTIIILSFAHPK